MIVSEEQPNTPFVSPALWHDLDLLARAKAVYQMRAYASTEDVADHLHITGQSVRNYYRAWELPETIKDLIRLGTVGLVDALRMGREYPKCALVELPGTSYVGPDFGKVSSSAVQAGSDYGKGPAILAEPPSHAETAEPDDPGPDPEAPKETCEQEFTKDDWTINMNSSRVQTYAELVAACKVDESIWEQERFRVKSYEVTYVPRSTRASSKDKWIRPSSKAVTVTMYALTASFVRKSAKKVKSGDRVEFLRQFHEIVDQDHFEFRTRQAPAIRSIDPLHKETAVVCCSDLHLTETVRPEDANGVNIYNSIIGANRLWEHAQKVKTLINLHRQMYQIERIWSPLLGDIINGTIHEEYVATNDLSDPAAVVLGGRLLCMFYRELESLGLPILIDAVHGNHPRLTNKVPTKRQAHTNLDWMIYEHLKDMFHGDDQIQLDICTAQLGMRRLYDWNYVFEHGIGVKNGAEEAFEDRIRALYDDPIYRRATGYQGASFDQAVIGNLHTAKFLERTVVNGSYIGQNELGQSWRLKPIKAQQLMWGVSKHHVRTWQYEVDMTDIKHASPDNPFSEYATYFMKQHG